MHCGEQVSGGQVSGGQASDGQEPMTTAAMLEVKAFFAQGVDQSLQGNHQVAIQHFDRALSLNPEDATVYGHRCVARYRLGDRVGAIADCQQAATLYLEKGEIKHHHYALKMLEKLQN